MVKSKKRQRKLDLNSLSEEDFQRVQDQISEKLRIILDEACEKANELTNPLGATVKMQFHIEPKEQI